MLEKTIHGQDCKEITRLIISLSENVSPQLRNPTSCRAKEVLERKLVDPTGTEYMKQQKYFLRMLYPNNLKNL